MFYKKLEFKPDRLVFQDSEPQNGEGNDGEVVDDTAEQAQQTIQESLQEAQLLTEHLIPSPNGEWQGQDVVFWGGRDEEIGDDDDGTADERVPLVIMQNEGSYFYIVQEGDSRDDVYDYFTETMADQDPERFGYLAEVRASKAGQSRSFNIDGGDTFKVGTLVPVFLNPETRPVSTVDFVNEYARPTLEIIKHDEFYAPYVKYLIDTMGEERLLSMMVAVACAETSYPIGTGVFHKYENQHKAFSLSCFHVLMNKDSPGMRARQRLQMSEGQTYQYSNACRLFLAFLIEKALEECDGAACNQDTISKEEKVRQALDVYQDDSSFRFQELETDGNIDKAIRTLNDEYGYLRNPSPYIKKLERYLSLMGRKVTSLQAKDGVGMGVDEDGPYVVFFNSKTPKAKEGETKSCSGKVRIDYSPSKVMGEVIGDFPDEQGWSYAGFQSFYGADTGDNYSGQLETRYTETLTWLQGGDPPVDPREVAAATTFEQLTPEEVEKNYPAYGALFAPSSTGLSPLKYLEHANASYESSPVITENPLPKLAEYYFQPYLNYLESNNRGPASTVLTDQLGL
ncbi:hypothetical protein HOM98_05355, partial [Candidatus Peregrinibacteria bacterium]|nr:hypothetical protein [Candidatus Peregrinibacteria bacterium]